MAIDEEDTERISYDDESSEDEYDICETREEDTDTEQEEELDAKQNKNASTSEQGESTFYIGRDSKTRWNKFPITQLRKKKRHNIAMHLPGPIGDATKVTSIMDCWNLFIGKDILEMLVKFTNEQIKKIQPNYGRERDANLTDLIEIKALIGILYVAGCKKLNRCNPDELWTADGTGLEIARTIMSDKRFKFLLHSLRFDDKNSRKERIKTDKLAAVRDMVDIFVNSCQQNYSMSEYCTIDEKLEGFRGRCGFRQHMPKKPNRHGIKIYILVDARMYYTYNLEIYCGKQPEGEYSVSNSPDQIVKRLVKPIAKSWRNLTVDNWFTSCSLVSDLLQDRITMVGTIRKNKRELPLRFTDVRSRKVYSSLFGFSKDFTLVSYVPKKNKNVLLLSSFHRNDTIDDTTGSRKKPEILTFYNLTKGGVDILDQLTSNYNVQRNTKRWTMVIFYCLLNIAGVNAHIIHHSNKNTTNDISRKGFLKQLGLELMFEQIERRKHMCCLPKDIRESAKRICPSPSSPKTSVETENKRKRCADCGRAKNRYTKYKCKKCEKFLCLSHITPMCKNCIEENRISI
ncbi:piggyBac transposable element-derived protein 4-like isoform X2 [Centruroides sculpturatus]|uniref:piggyBac transposable element-derived protein 4-like isoform X2 n=1 Tax=Centruroides sculpturatus TaxID=218467 RepID=UPI000C6DF40A|nr:piggyBac transposable element-derived protein 4-like isoform X2 [Centruroides sculpturatus]